MSRRVVVTGMGGLSPLGNDWNTIRSALQTGRSGVRRIDAWNEIEDLRTRLGAPVPDFDTPSHYPRKKVRSMGRVSLLATRAAELALEDAGLHQSPEVANGRTGIAFGSSAGSPPAIGIYARQLFVGKTIRGIGANDFLQFMSHTTAANLANFFGVTGRIIPTSSACTSGSQGIGFGYEAIRFGRQEIMLAGGAEELAAMDAAVFDVLFATSTRNGEPSATPRPFDSQRDGTVVGEGAGCLILEEREHAKQRGAHIYAELLGFGTNCDGQHLTNPDAAGMEQVMRLGLDDAGIDAGDVGYVNAHGTSTEAGDIAESHATAAVFGTHTPTSSLKGHLGHTLGACGALEAWITIAMIREGWAAPTLNLDHIDERCAPLDFIRDKPRDIDTDIVVSNNFAFGGVNTSLVFRVSSGDRDFR
jgi:3-oxoacyl-[acyl-carrier-protein] synthase II